MSGTAGGQRPSRPRRLASELRAFGALVRSRRIARGWTLEQAAERMRLDLKHLQRIEAGSENVTLVTLLRIATAYEETFVLPLASVPAQGMPARERALVSNAVKPPRPERHVDADGALIRNVGRRLAELRAERRLTLYRSALWAAGRLTLVA